MQCPKCQVEIPEWHFYCPNCRIQIQTYEPDGERPKHGRFDRAGARALIALAWLSVIIALVLIGRAAVWGELLAAIRGDTSASAKVETGSKVKPTPRARSDKGQVDGKGSKAAKVAESSEPEKTGKKAPVEGGNAPKSQEVSPSAEKKEKKEKKAQTESPPSTPEKVGKPPSVQDQSQSQIPVERLDAKNSDETGVVINSSTPARIYINGQFSGDAPLSIRMSPGDYQIKLIADGYEDWTRRVRVKNKQRVEITALLKKKGAQKD